MRAKQTEMKGNGQSIWSKMDREQSNVTHDSSTLAVRFFSYAANRVDNVVLSLGYISQTHVMNKHMLSTYLLCHARNAHCRFFCCFLSSRLCQLVLPWFPVVVCYCISPKICQLLWLKCQSGNVPFLNRRQFSRRVGFRHCNT